MRLFNADGSRAEVSGNGVRGLAALLLRDDERARRAGHDRQRGRRQAAGRAPAATASRQTFRAAMGLPVDLRQVRCDRRGRVAAGCGHELRQPAVRRCSDRCPTTTGSARLGAALEHHAMFPGTARTSSSRDVEAPDRVRILIWERGVGPTIVVGNRIVRGAGRRRGVRRRGARRRGHRAGRRAAGRVARRQRLPDRLGGNPLRGALVAKPVE